jgi:hypothetical protein
MELQTTMATPTETQLSAATSDYGPVVDKFAHEAFPNLSQARGYTGILCHYTSFETSQKILEGNTFRLTHMRCMNDYEEMRYGCDMFYRLIHMIREAQDDQRIKNFFKILFLP